MVRYRSVRSVLVLSVFAAPPFAVRAQPIDLFSDAPRLAGGFVRIGAWNLRHINVEGDADDCLPGATKTEDFAILIETFAKGIVDLGLDLVAIVEHQPRAGEPNRLHQIRDQLVAMTGRPWNSDESNIDYDPPFTEFGHLQFAVLWDPGRVTIDPDPDMLLDDLRQPRDDDGHLERKDTRAPWLVPVRAGNLEFDLIVLHLKSGGAAPQADEVTALAGFIHQHQTQPSPRHLVVCGDWNIRPDRSGGRFRLRKLQSAGTEEKVMRVVTVEDIPPTLDWWPAFDDTPAADPVLATLPYTHFNDAPIRDAFLDHMAISMTLNETFDNPIQVQLADGSLDLQPGIRIAVPLIPEASYLNLTDHLPVVLLLRTDPEPAEESTCQLRIAAAMPNPSGKESQFEAVHLRNMGEAPVSLTGWRVADSRGAVWTLDGTDGTASAGGTVVVLRRGRPMGLNNEGDTIVLLRPDGSICDTESYGDAGSDVVIQFP